MQLGLAHHRDQHVERLLGDPVDLLDVQQRAVAQGRDQRAVDEHVGGVAVGQHPGRVEVADQARRRQLGVALDELEADAELVGHGTQQRRLAGAGRAFQQHMATGRERGNDQLDLARAADDRDRAAIDERCGVVIGYPRPSVVDHHAADVLAGAHVFVALVDRRRAGTCLVTRPSRSSWPWRVQIEQLGDVGAGCPNRTASRSSCFSIRVS